MTLHGGVREGNPDGWSVGSWGRDGESNVRPPGRRLIALPGIRGLFATAAGGTLLCSLAFLADRSIPIPDQAVGLIAVATFALALLSLRTWRNRLTRGAIGWHLHKRARSFICLGLRACRRYPATVAVSVVVLYLGLHAVRGARPPCELLVSDCGMYVAMVESLSYQESLVQEGGYGTHQLMRVLPPLLVRGTMVFGLDVHQGFRLVSLVALVGFGLGLLWALVVLSRNYALAVGLTLVILGIDNQMTEAFRDVYRTTDAMGFLIGLLIILAAMAGRRHVTGLLSLLGVLTKQVLLPLSGLTLAYLFLQPSAWREKLTVGAWALAVVGLYGVLGAYYRGHETVVRHLVPNAESSELITGFFAGGGHGPLLLILPLLLLSGPRIVRVASRHWYVLGYALIALAQPIMMLGQEDGVTNLRRVMLHGAWPVYFLAALAIIPRRPGHTVSLSLLALGSLAFSSNFDLGFRVAVVAAILVGLGLSRVAVGPLGRTPLRVARNVREPQPGRT